MKLLVFLLLISSTHQFPCISWNSSFNFSTLSFNTTELEKIITNLEPMNSRAKKCRVELTLNYTEHRLSMVFNPTRHNGGDILVGRSKLITTFTLNSHMSSIASVLVHTCSIKDACERDFVLDRYLWLFNQNYTETQQQLTKLLLRGKDLPVKCYTNSSETSLTQCKGAVCNGFIRMGFYFMYQTFDHNVMCAAKDKQTTSVRISTGYSDEGNCEQHEEIFYTCMYHGCNSETTSENILNSIRKSYSICRERYVNITRRTTPTTTTESTSTIKTTIRIQSPQTTTIYKKGTVSMTISNRSLTTDTASKTMQYFQVLSSLIKINFSVLITRFLLVGL